MASAVGNANREGKFVSPTSEGAVDLIRNSDKKPHGRALFIVRPLGIDRVKHPFVRFAK